MISIWCDFLRKDFIEKDLKLLIDSKKILGATSNPSIFASALKSPVYASDISSLKHLDAKSIYESLAIKDVQNACKSFYSLYMQDQNNGLVSLELDPSLSHDIDLSIKEGIRLWESISCRNAMIKVPATKEGFIVMKELMALNININATLVFTKDQALECLKAFRAARSLSARGVISVFVSRFDRAIDSKINSSNKGRLGILNAIDIYNSFKACNPSFLYRILFASTAPKSLDSTYKDLSYYIYPLAFRDAINTTPLSTIYDIDYKKLNSPSFINLNNNFISENEISNISKALLKEGINIFKDSFKDMLEQIQNSKDS